MVAVPRRRRLVDLEIIMESLKARNPEYARLLEELRRRPLSTSEAAALVEGKSNKTVYGFLRRLEAKGLIEGRLNPVTNEVVWYFKQSRGGRRSEE
ncbi:hypothetical protein Pyrde_0709 [Pyrodictium delaneyi]|uniref:Transcription regulator TrmB N-terminal domain-containing protein n=1 Tax=Pyrodictium delaneyi TaxID=1273541 RepID=A0A0P0N2C0_9CREN|nr:hypothetical protein Pyrde_0709 [Pyrodictium delaneyi]